MCGECDKLNAKREPMTTVPFNDLMELIKSTLEVATLAEELATKVDTMLRVLTEYTRIVERAVSDGLDPVSVLEYVVNDLKAYGADNPRGARSLVAYVQREDDWRKRQQRADRATAAGFVDRPDSVHAEPCRGILRDPEVGGFGQPGSVAQPGQPS